MDRLSTDQMFMAAMAVFVVGAFALWWYMTSVEKAKVEKEKPLTQYHDSDDVGDMATVFGKNPNPNGLVGSYSRSDQYVYGDGKYDWSTKTNPGGGYGADWTERSGNAAEGTGANLPGGGFGLASHQLFPSTDVSGDGFSDIQISAPPDLLHADNLLDDVSVITSTRNQSRDLRGEPAVDAVYSYDESGELQPGPFGGMGQSSYGAYGVRKPVRTYIA